MNKSESIKNLYPKYNPGEKFGYWTIISKTTKRSEII